MKYAPNSNLTAINLFVQQQKELEEKETSGNTCLTPTTRTGNATDNVPQIKKKFSSIEGILGE